LNNMVSKEASRLWSEILSFRGLLSIAFLCPFAATSWGTAQDRPPAVPLVAYDPYFSLWSMSDKLTDSNTRHWTGSEQPLSGLVRIDGMNYRYMDPLLCC